MPIPLEISFRGMQPSPAVETRVRGKVAQLERYYDRIESMNVIIEAASHRHHKGDLYNVRIDIAAPAKDVFVDHVGRKNHAHENINVAIRDAFDAARRRLQDHAAKLAGDVKRHSLPG